MPKIELTTWIAAPPERVFDLSRSIDFHQYSTSQTLERAIGGRTSGLIQLGEEVTWSAVHLGVRQELTSRITHFERPRHFADTMVRGAFAHMVHHHYYDAVRGETAVREIFTFESPFGIVGRAFDALFLAGYMREFLVERNRKLKLAAESEEWRKYLPTPP